jgi:predicted GIY-YIG superfamily endonuclease
MGGIVMSRKTVDFSKEGISHLPNDKPVIYRILSESGKNNYTGVAQRGRVAERLQEHLPGNKDHVPGSKVRVEQMKSIAEATNREAHIISRSKPKYNRKGT